MLLARRGAARGVGVSLLLVAALPLLACNAILGIEEPEPLSSGGSCLLPSDCKLKGEVCLFETCSPPCNADRDCAQGSRCLQTGDGVACVTSDAARCESGADCPAGTVCYERTCLTSCSASAAAEDGCLEDQRCEPDVGCVSSAFEAGLEAGMPSALGKDAGASGDAGLEAGAPASDGAVAATDAGVDAAALCEEGAMVCDGAASVQRLVCHDGSWESADPCEDGQLCDRDSDPPGGCADVEPACRGRTPGETFCEGVTRTTCGPDLVTIAQEECPSAQHCALATTESCAACLPGEARCDGNVLSTCNADYTKLEPGPTCTSSEPCNEQAGACTAFACLPNQRRCNGDDLEVCNDDQSAFTRLMGCEAGMCDPVALECDACAAGTSGCADVDRAVSCSSDGQTETFTDCPSGSPFCIGNGACVECQMKADCTSSGQCLTASCNTGSGTCVETPKSVNTTCSQGYCDGGGACVECNSPGQCSTTGDCYSAECDDNACGQSPRGVGSACSSAGGSMCDGGGACVECTAPNQCGTTNDCYSAQCSSNTCGEAPRAINTSCSSGGGTRCDGAGACVECNTANQCSTTNDCYSAQCSSHACGQTPKAINTSCSSSGGNRCDGAGACVECNSAGQCTASGQCYTATCSGHACGQTPKSSGTSCSAGGSYCDGAGACVMCLTQSHCAQNEVCRNASCLTATHDVGWSTPLSGSANVVGDWLYLFRLPPLSYDAILLYFGAVGNASGATARMVLYRDNGSGTAPTGAPVAETVNPIALIDGPREQSATPQPVLDGGATYWVGLVANTSTSMRSQSSGGAVGTRLPHAYGDPFPSGSSGIATNGVNWNIYIYVQDIE